MSKPKALAKASKEYDESLESRFRRELETVLVLISARLDDISNGSDTNASLYSRREHYVSPPVRVVRYSAAGAAAGITYS
jgi:hypothetical protein